MNYQEFISLIKENVSGYFDEKTSVSIQHTTKNNGTTRIGLSISNVETNISPTIYLEEFFLQFQNGRPAYDIANNIVELYEEVKFDHPWDVEQIQNIYRAKSKLVYKLIHYNRNKTFLKDIPHIPYLDLAIVFCIYLEQTERGSATILVTNDLLKTWNLSTSELLRIASENTPEFLTAELKPMHMVIMELSNYAYKYDENHESQMHVLSNEYGYLGAACILYDHVLEDIGNLFDEDYYVLPSSIHEVIILPASCHFTQDELSEMVNEINKTQVSEEEILSDHAYYFNRELNQLLISQ